MGVKWCKRIYRCVCVVWLKMACERFGCWFPWMNSVISGFLLLFHRCRTLAFVVAFEKFVARNGRNRRAQKWNKQKNKNKNEQVKIEILLSDRMNGVCSAYNCALNRFRRRELDLPCFVLISNIAVAYWNIYVHGTHNLILAEIYTRVRWAHVVPWCIDMCLGAIMPMFCVYGSSPTHRICECCFHLDNDNGSMGREMRRERRRRWMWPHRPMAITYKVMFMSCTEWVSGAVDRPSVHRFPPSPSHHI